MNAADVITSASEISFSLRPRSRRPHWRLTMCAEELVLLLQSAWSRTDPASISARSSSCKYDNLYIHLVQSNPLSGSPDNGSNFKPVNGSGRSHLIQGVSSGHEVHDQMRHPVVI